MELLLQEEVNNPLVLAGRKGWKMEHFLESIGDKYWGNVLVTGFIEDEDLPYVYDLAQCFIFPSIYEGFGILRLRHFLWAHR